MNSVEGYFRLLLEKHTNFSTQKGNRAGKDFEKDF